jgi:hypothetical protein
LPDNATILSATFNIHGIELNPQGADGTRNDLNLGVIDREIALVGFTPADTHTYTADDYDQFGVVQWADNIDPGSDFSNWYTPGLNTFRFNTVGRSGISRTSNTVFGLRLEADRANTEPMGLSSVDSNALIYSHFSEEPGVDKDPCIEVAYMIDTNTPPTLDPIDDKTVDEGALLEFTVTASDPDFNNLTLSASNLPTGATFNPSTGVFTWTPTFDDAGAYPGIEFTATDDGDPVESTSETITITVVDVNRAPILDTIGDQVVNEGALLEFTVTASDTDFDNLVFSAANLPSGATFVGDTFSWTPTFSQEGNYTDVEFTVTDDGGPMELDVELITITVGNVNRAPVFDPLGAQEVLETATLTFNVTATDPDLDTVVVSAGTLPMGATFTSGVFDWTPDQTQAGIYVVEFTATDDGTPVESMTLEVSITVGDVPTPCEQNDHLIEVILTP